MAEIRWLPLESNPEVMNKYVQSLGVSEQWQFVDVWGFEKELLDMIPRPICAVLLLFPISEKSESCQFGNEDHASGLYFIKQTIGNACGTIGIIHALCNNDEKLGFDREKHLSKFFGDTKDLSPEERGKHLETDEAFGEAHDEVAREGQTRAPSHDDHVDLHFVAFVHHKGTLYELDGRRNAPVSHGPTTEDTLLEDTAEVVKKFMARDPDNLNFTVVALAKTE
jgi:ubiquitin carboxyl-terminal hydrolase L3